MSDFREHCPAGDAEEFHLFALTIVERIAAYAPEKIKKGRATSINDKLSRLRNALKVLTPQARREINNRQIRKAVELRISEYGETAEEALAQISCSDITDGDASILKQLELLLDDDISIDAKDPRRWLMVNTAVGLWHNFGGKVTCTDTQNIGNFVPFLDALLSEAGLSFDPVQLTKEYLKAPLSPELLDWTKFVQSHP